jgi:ribosomal protein S18 acetylase RimI-like enzyme
MIAIMDKLEIVRARSWSEVEHPAALLGLVDEIVAGPPYSYAPGEITPTVDWFPALVDKAGLTLVARRDGEPVGYGVALPFETYGKLGDFADRLGVRPATTMYLAELGVSSTARRQGIAGRLVDDLHTAFPAGTAASVVRTLAGNEPAVALYRRHGYQLVDGVTQQWNGRERIFLIRQEF